MTQKDQQMNIIKQAKEQLVKSCGYNDHELALYMVRDLQVTRDAKLSDLAWAMYRHSCTKSEVEWLVDKLETHLAQQQQEELEPK